MKKRFKVSTLFLGILTGASTLAMIIQNKPQTYITGGIAIVTFIISTIIDIREGE
jgi:hypothetical protein